MTTASTTPAAGWPHGTSSLEQRLGNATTRVIIGAIAIPIVLGTVWLGGWAFFLFILAVTIGAVLEFYWIAERKGARPHKLIGVLFSALLVFGFFHGVSDTLLVNMMGSESVAGEGAGYARLHARFLWIVVPLLLLVAATLLAGMRRQEGSPILGNATTIAGVCYVALFLATLLGIRQFFGDGLSGFADAGAAVDASAAYQRGFSMVMSILVSIWVCDSAAYYAGRALGKHKLAERISPKKTWEGAIAGAIFAVITMVVLQQLLLTFLGLFDAIVIGLVVGIFGQLGDLAESHLKRDAGVKDSSHLIPGHGGIFDRFDSIIFVSPLVYLYLNIAMS